MATINYNSSSSTGTAAEIAITTESTLTLYNIPSIESDHKYRLGIDVSPDSGTTWVRLPDVLSRKGCMTVNVAATKARVRVFDLQGSASTGVVFLIAR